MLKSVYVDGLKSLKDLHLELRPGLNVLVGPNGSGKSNILSAIELISNLNDIDFLNSKGNLRSIEFANLFDSLRNERKIKIAVSGENNVRVAVGSSLNGGKKRSASLFYTYKCELGYQPELKKKLFFSQQLLDLHVFHKKSGFSKKLIVEYRDDRIIVRHCDSQFPIELTGDLGEEAVKKVIAATSDGAMESSGQKFPSSKVEEFVESKNRERVLMDALEEKWNLRKNVLRHSSLMNELIHEIKIIQSVAEDMNSGKVYDIDPGKIRENIRKLDCPVVSHDGTRLLSTLLRVSERSSGSKNIVFDWHESKDKYKGMYETIVAYLHDVLPEAVGLNFNFDEAREEIDGKVVLQLENGKETELEIEALSDGLLKWLSLVTVLLTTENLFLLEYPENSLHAKMQHLIVDLMRETIHSKNDIRLFTTHCETILNLLEPEEIILTYFRNGRTLVERIEEPEFVRKAVEDTGLGIGWQMVSGAFDYDEVVGSLRQ